MGISLTTHMMAERYAVTARTIRFYEERGMLTPMKIGTRRLYDARERKKLEFILQGKILGLSLTEISILIDSASNMVMSHSNIASIIGKSKKEAHIAELEKRKAAP